MKVWLCVVMVLTSMVAARAGESDQWFKLVTELQAQEGRLSAPHRKFLGEIANFMTAGDDWMPSKRERAWLLTIKERLDAGKRSDGRGAPAR